MAAFAQEMELLSRQLSQAHRAAIQAELLAAGLEEVNHPMLVSLLQCAEEDPAYPCQAQRDLAQQLHVSPAAVANALKGLERSGCIRREPWQDDARRNRVLLTEKGRAAVAGCREAFRRVSRTMLTGCAQAALLCCTLEEQALLLAFERRMLQNLTRNTNNQKED